jgi:hypothetical protein
MPHALGRFLLLAFPLLVLTMGLGGLALETFDLVPDAGELARLGLAARPSLGSGRVLGGWVLESLALLALFLLLQGRTSARWLDGVAAAWIAWIYRGPVLVLTVLTWTSLSRQPWWGLSLYWLVLYTLCGLILGAVARGVRLEH